MKSGSDSRAVRATFDIDDVDDVDRVEGADAARGVDGIEGSRRSAATLLWILMGCLAGATASASDDLRLNQLVVKGTHNSYHKRPFIPLHKRHRYSHDSLRVQLQNHGVRAMEFDLHLSLRRKYQIYHIALIDSRSHCKLFEDCLRQLRDWSDGHRDHEPLMIWLEAKDFAGGRRMKSLKPVDEVIRQVVGDRLITPDDVRGEHASLRQALAIDGWPTLGESRGKFIFMLTSSSEQSLDYTSGSSHLRGRAMFMRARPGQLGLPWAAVVKPAGPESSIIDPARRAGMIVSTTTCVATMTDAMCARDRDLALARGANVLLDDYPHPVPRRDYYLEIGSTHIAAAVASSGDVVLGVAGTALPDATN